MFGKLFSSKNNIDAGRPASANPTTTKKSIGSIFGSKTSKKKLWGKLRLVVKTGMVQNIDWRKSNKSNKSKKSPNAERKAAAFLFNKIKKARNKNTKEIHHAKKINRFKQHATRRSSFLSTNAGAKQAVAVAKAAAKLKRTQDTTRMQRRRSMATGEIMKSIAGRPQSAPMRRKIVKMDVEDETALSSSEDEEGEITEDQGKNEHEHKSDKEIEETLKKSKLLELGKAEIKTKTLLPSVKPDPLSTEEIIEKACFKHKGLNVYGDGPPMSSLHIPKSKFWGRDQMSTVFDGRNKCRLPTFALEGNAVVWVAGANERRNYKYGFRPFCATTVRDSDIYSKDHDILDIACQSALRTVFVTQKRGTSNQNKVWFTQGEAQLMKGQALCKSEITEVTHLPNDVEHVACTKGRIYALTNRGEVFSIAPKPQDDPRYVWETSKPNDNETVNANNNNVNNVNTELLDLNGKSNNSFFIRRMPSLCKKRIISIAAGSNHTVCINHDGMCWSWGEGVALGLGEHIVDVAHPTLLKELYTIRKLKVIQISAGSHHTLALAVRLNESTANKTNPKKSKASKASKVSKQLCLSWGAWDSRLGTLRRSTTATLDTMWSPCVMNRIKKSNRCIFASLHAGGKHSIGLEKKGGVLWCWGNNDVGQLGLGHIKSIWTPTKLRHPTNIIDVGVGERHTVVVTSLGDVWSFGDNSEGSLGLSGGLDCRIVPRIVMGPLHGIKAMQVKVGGKVTIIVTQKMSHDTHGKWISINRASRTMIDHRDSRGHRFNRIEENGEENEVQQPILKKKKGWGRIKTFEKARIKKEKQQALEKRQTKLKKKEEREKKRKLGDTDSDSDDENGRDILREIKDAKKKKAELETIHLLRHSLFMKPAITLTQRKFDSIWMHRAPKWMLLCAEWKDNVQARSNVILSSDRTLWLRGRTTTLENEPTTGREVRVETHSKLYQIRDAFFKLRKYVNLVVKAQAIVRGMAVRNTMQQGKRQELSLKKQKQKDIKTDMLQKKQQRIKRARRKSIISLPPRISAEIGIAAFAKKLKK